MVEPTENVKVVVRIRPLQPHEISKGEIVSISPTEDGKRLQIIMGELEAKTFKCTTCFSRETMQETIFRKCGIVGLINSACEGYRSCVFAFGQTGSGKTHTVVGSSYPTSEIESGSGLLVRSIHFLFDELERKNVNFIVKISCMEIYHEHVFDLFTEESNRRSLPVREHPTDGFYVEGSHRVPCPDRDSACIALEKALANRTIGSHDMNSRSNRSHCLTEIYVETPLPKDNSVAGEDRAGRGEGGTEKEYLITGRLSLVDLAGSERLKHTNSAGKVLKDTGFINKSLYILGKVIVGLSREAERTAAERASRARTGSTSRRQKGKPGVRAHPVLGHLPGPGGPGMRDIPYRDSKLTKLLYQSLGGRGRTLVIACVSEASGSVSESLRTLQFSMAAARIKNRPVQFIDPKEKLILDLKQEIRRLRSENERLKTVNELYELRQLPQEKDKGGAEGDESEVHSDGSDIGYNDSFENEEEDRCAVDEDDDVGESAVEGLVDSDAEGRLNVGGKSMEGKHLPQSVNFGPQHALKAEEQRVKQPPGGLERKGKPPAPGQAYPRSVSELGQIGGHSQRGKETSLEDQELLSNRPETLYRSLTAEGSLKKKAHHHQNHPSSNGHPIQRSSAPATSTPAQAGKGGGLPQVLRKKPDVISGGAGKKAGLRSPSKHSSPYIAHRFKELQKQVRQQALRLVDHVEAKMMSDVDKAFAYGGDGSRKPEVKLPPLKPVVATHLEPKKIRNVHPENSGHAPPVAAHASGHKATVNPHTSKNEKNEAAVELYGVKPDPLERLGGEEVSELGREKNVDSLSSGTNVKAQPAKNLDRKPVQEASSADVWSKQESKKPHVERHSQPQVHGKDQHVGDLTRVARQKQQQPSRPLTEFEKALLRMEQKAIAPKSRKSSTQTQTQTVDTVKPSGAEGEEEAFHSAPRKRSSLVPPDFSSSPKYSTPNVGVGAVSQLIRKLSVNPNRVSQLEAEQLSAGDRTPKKAEISSNRAEAMRAEGTYNMAWEEEGDIEEEYGEKDNVRLIEKLIEKASKDEPAEPMSVSTTSSFSSKKQISNPHHRYEGIVSNRKTSRFDQEQAELFKGQPTAGSDPYRARSSKDQGDDDGDGDRYSDDSFEEEDDNLGSDNTASKGQWFY